MLGSVNNSCTVQKMSIAAYLVMAHSVRYIRGLFFFLGGGTAVMTKLSALPR